MFARIILATAAMAVFAAVPAFAQSVVGRNTNAVGPFPDGFYKGIPHYQDNEPHCDRNPLLDSNIICLVNGYNGADDAIGDGWPKILETQDNARTWSSRFATGSLADPISSLGLGFGADPIMVCWPGGCGGFFIASNRAEGGGSGGGVYMQLLPELNVETGFRHYSEQGPRTIQLGTGDNFLDKIDAIFIVDEQNPGTVDLSIEIEKGNGITEVIDRTWPKGRLIVVYAAINSSSQNVRIFSTYSDDFGANWSPPKQVANATGIDTGVAVAAIQDTVVYAYRQFADDSGDQTDAVYAAVSTTGGRNISKPFAVVADLCPFDQPTLAIEATVDGNPVGLDVVASRSNNFVDISTDRDNFVIALTQRNRAPDGSCLTQPFDYAAGSRVYLTTAGSSGKNWSGLVPLAPRDSSDGPRNGHSFQLMPAVDCALGVCQAIWYDSIRDSIRNLGFLESAGKDAAADRFEQFPFLADFFLPTGSAESPEALQFRRTADIYTRRFRIRSNTVQGIDFEDLEPVRVTRFQLARLPSPGPVDAVFEVEQLPFNIKQYKGNSASFMGDYVGLASKKVRARSGITGPGGEPVYESNAGFDSANPLLKPSWFAYWTDTREVRGQLYSQSAEEALPFAKSPSASAFAKLEEPEAQKADDYVEDLDTELGRERTAEGLEDTNPGVGTCERPDEILPLKAGDSLPLYANINRIKDADVYGALIGSPATAWVLNTTKSFGPGRPQRAFTIAARNEEEARSKTFRFRIMNQPVGAPLEARASWLQLPYKDFDRADTPDPLLEVDEDVGPLSSVTVALFVVSQQAINPVTVNVYEVVTDGNGSEQEFLVETLTVNGTLEGGDLVSINPFLPDVNIAEIHDPSVFAPTDYDPALDPANPQIWNPQIWNPQIWNPQIWNPQIWNPQIWNPQIWNPQIWNPQIWNPQIWNPQIWNTSVTDADELDNEEIPEPELSELVDADGNAPDPGQPLAVAKVDAQFGVSNDGNTTTPYTADFAVNSPLVRQRIAEDKVKIQVIVWEDARLETYQACDLDPTAGQLRIIAAVNNPDLLNLKVPDIFNNRFGSVTYYLEPNDTLQITLRFIGFPEVIQEIAPELINGGISYVVTSQAANTGEDSLSPGDSEQVISDQVPPTIAVNQATPVELTALARPDAQGNLQVGAVLPGDLVTASKGEFEPSLAVSCVSSTAGNVELGEFAAVGLGQSTLTCSATAANSVSANVEFGLDIRDVNPPELSGVPASFLLERELVNGTDLSATAQAVAAVFNSSDDLPVATDDIDSAVAVQCAYASAGGNVPLVPGGLAPFDPAGNPTATVVTCTATDSSGNSTSDSFTITVRDVTPPVLAPIADVSVAAAAVGGTIVSVSAPSATDAGNIVASDCKAFDPPTSVVGMSLFPIGTTPVTCSATDDVQNTGTTSFTVAVIDMTPPLFDTTVDDFTAEANAIGGANVTFTAPTASDLGQAVPVQCDANPAGSFFPIGATTVTCTATDAQGNVATDTFVVTVADTTPPVLTVPNDITALFGATVAFEATATDNADADPVINCSPPSGTVFPLGSTTVDCTATDDAGLEDTGSFTVNVVLGGTSSLSSNKNSVNSGAVAGFTWVWEDYLGNPVDVGEGNQDVEARPGNCPSTADDVLNEDPGSSDIRLQTDGQWTFNWQTVDDFGNPIAAGTYCFSVVLMTTEPPQRQSTEIRVR
jgi:hypothetical protein